MPATPIVTDNGSWLYPHPKPVVYIADSLAEAEFEEVPYLRCKRLREAAAPEIGHAILVYDYGRIAQEDPVAPIANYEPLDIVGKFIKIETVATVDGDPDHVWYGIIEGNQRAHHGTGDDALTPTGNQSFMAYDVLRLLDKQPVRSSFVETGDLDGVSPVAVETKAGLPFGSDRSGAIPSRKNRGNTLWIDAAAETDEDDRHYLFSAKARDDQDWDAYEAVRYLLYRHTPKDSAGDPANTWRFKADTDAGLIDWYDVAVQTDGRTVKAILDDLLPRQRGIGYRAFFDPADDTCRIEVFTFAEADITLPSGATLKANPELRTLDFDQAFDIDTCNVADLEGGRFHKVIARGEKRTTTFSQSLQDVANQLLIPDWTTDEEDEYFAGASGETWYAALETGEKELANAAARASEKLKHVFTRFRLTRKPADDMAPNLWIRGTDGQNWAGTETRHYLAPDLDTDPLETVFTPDGPFPGGFTGNQVWPQGVRFMRSLPLYERYDYTGTNIETGESAWKGTLTDGEQPDFLSPFAFAVIKSGESENDRRIIPLHRMHETAFDASNGRHWSVGLEISSNDPSVLLRCHPNHFLARQRWADETGKAATAQDQNPELANGLDRSDIYITLCAELDEHVTAEEEISAPGTGVPVSELVIPCPDCRADWVAPYTVVEIRAGQMAKSTSGGFVRDDRERLKDIARAAAEWYGRTRQTLRLSYRTLRPLFQIGWLITEFGFQKTAVNTPITAIDYNFGNGKEAGSVTIETSFAALDTR